MKFVSKYILYVLISIFVFSNAFAQDDLNTTLSKLTQDAAGHYVAPIVSAFGADLNSGWLTFVPKPKLFGVDINLKLVVMGTLFQDANKTFSTSAKFRFSSNEADILVSSLDPSVRSQVKNQILSQDFVVGIDGPTIIGSKDNQIVVHFQGATINGQNIASQDVPTDITGVLGDIPILPLVAPQLTIGTVYGSSLSIRYLPSIQINSDLGDFNYFGIGVMHNPSVWMKNPLPLDVAVGIFTQTMKVGNIFKASATEFGVFAGKTFGLPMLSVSPYAGLAVESSTITVSYVETFDTPTGTQSTNLSFDLTGDNTFRFTLGSTFKLGVISLNADYSFASYSVFSAGLGLDF